MLSNIVLYLGIILTIFIYIRIIITYITNTKNNNNITASELGIKILNNEYSINLIKSKESIFSKYNIRRKMVKLSTNTYDSNNSFSLAIASLLSNYSIINNKSLNLIGKIFKEIKFITFSPIITIIASSLARNVGDSKLCMIILILIAIYQYMLNNINNEVIERTKDKDEKINKILKLFANTTTISFIVTLTQIIRLVIIILEI